MKKIDAHFHFYKETFLPELMLKEMDEAGIEKIAVMPAISALDPPDINAGPIKLMRFLMGKKVFFGLLRKMLSTFNGDGIDVLGKHNEIYFTSDNESVYEVIKDYPDRFCLWAGVNPEYPETIEELKKWVVQDICIGAKVHPFYHQYSAALLEPVFELLDKAGKSMIIHMGFEDLGVMLHFAEKYPKVNIILAHCAFPYFQLGWKEIRKHPNLYVDISSGAYVDAKIARKCVDALGSDHVLYGTDGPFGTYNEHGRFDMKTALEHVTAKLNEAEKKQILYDNFFRYFCSMR